MMAAVFRDVDKLDPMPDSLVMGQDQQYLVSCACQSIPDAAAAAGCLSLTQQHIILQ
jgi:hypothetical protein